MGGVERGDVIYNSSGAGSAAPSSSSSSSQQQQPAAIYSVPHANRNAGTERSAATDARYAGYESPGAALSPGASGAVDVGESAAVPAPGGAAAPEIVYATPLDGRLVVPRMPNPVYQSADGPPNDQRSLVRVPNVMYEPAANNVYDAGVNNGGGGSDYYDADPVPNAEYNSSA